MQVVIKYNDDQSFTAEEIVRLARHNYGDKVKVQVEPDSHAPHDLILFALQQMITHRQLSAFYDNRDMYPVIMSNLRRETLVKLAELVDTVIIENEGKVAV